MAAPALQTDWYLVVPTMDDELDCETPSFDSLWHSFRAADGNENADDVVARYGENYDGYLVKASTDAAAMNRVESSDPDNDVIGIVVL